MPEPNAYLARLLAGYVIRERERLLKLSRQPPQSVSLAAGKLRDIDPSYYEKAQEIKDWARNKARTNA